jgi:hypothetical protein
MRESTARYDVERIAFLRPDVAVVSVRPRPVTLAGDPLEGAPEGRPTYVVTREGVADHRSAEHAGQGARDPASPLRRQARAVLAGAMLS